MKQLPQEGKITGETKWHGTIVKVGWELNAESLTLETGESMKVDSINFVKRVGEAYRFWAEGIEHVLELSDSDETEAAVKVIQQRIQARIDRGENLSFAAATGRMLSSSCSAHGGICILTSIVLLVFSAIGFYSWFTQPQKGGLGGTIMALLAAVALFALGRIKRPRLDVFETEVQNYSFFGKQTNLKYEDIEGLTCCITRILNESGKETRVHTKIAIDGPEGTFKYSDSGGGAKALESLKETITNELIPKFWTALQQGRSIPFGSKSSLTPTGLEQADGSVISYADISEVRTLVGEGKIQLFLKDERKPALKMKSREKNFYPCVELLSLLADPSITYKEYCSNRITPATSMVQTSSTNDSSTATRLRKYGDPKPTTDPGFRKSLLGILGVIFVAACVILWTVFSKKNDNQGQVKEAADGANTASATARIHEVLAGLDQDAHALAQSTGYLSDTANYDPAEKDAVQDKLIKILAANPLQLQGDMEMFSIWFDREDTKRISALLKNPQQHAEAGCLVKAMAKIPGSVPAMILELGMHVPSDDVSHALQQELHLQGVDSMAISRQLSTKLRATTDSKTFETITLVLKSMSWDTAESPELKTLIADSMAAAGRNITADQLQKMDADVGTAITTFARLPESADLLEKLAATSTGARNVMMFLRRDEKSSEAGNIAAKLARENKIHPREVVGFENSELVQEFLWEGKLTGKSEFLNLDININSNSASLNGFSAAGVSLINSDPKGAIKSLLTVVAKRRNEITRERLSDKFLEKLDSLLANKLKDDLRLPSSSSNTDKAGQSKPRKMPDSLILAELLGGKNAAMAISQAGKKKPEVLRGFKGMLGAMIALNEPETYGMIVNAWVIHGDADGLENIGPAIERPFIQRLEIRLKKLNPADKGQRRAIHFLMGALKKIGTTESVPILTKLTKSELVGFRKASQQALDTIHQRSSQQ